MTAMLDGRVVIVIGGLGLIGRALVAGIAGAGARTVVASRGAGHADALAAFATLPADERGRIEARTVDITDTAAVAALIDGVVADHGRVDAVVNCAYPQQDGFGIRFEEVDPAVFAANVSRHLGAYMRVAQRALAQFASQGHGCLVQFASIYGVMNPRFEIYDGTGMTKEIDYSVAKAGIIHMTGYLARYYRGTGIRVNCISPGGVRNGQHPDFLSRYDSQGNGTGMMAAADITGTTLYLLSDAAARVTGQNLVVDDGFSL